MGRLFAPTATILIIPTHARRMAITGRIGLSVASSSARDPGTTRITGTGSMIADSMDAVTVGATATTVIPDIMGADTAMVGTATAVMVADTATGAATD
jgi:hypothetical protein